MTPEEVIRGITARYDDGNGEGEQLAEEAIAALHRRQRSSGKPCGTCGEDKPLSSFSKRASSRDGLEYVCRACRSRVV